MPPLPPLFPGLCQHRFLISFLYRAGSLALLSARHIVSLSRRSVRYRTSPVRRDSSPRLAVSLAIHGGRGTGRRGVIGTTDGTGRDGTRWVQGDRAGAVGRQSPALPGPRPSRAGGGDRRPRYQREPAGQFSTIRRVHAPARGEALSRRRQMLQVHSLATYLHDRRNCNLLKNSKFNTSVEPMTINPDYKLGPSCSRSPLRGCLSRSAVGPCQRLYREEPSGRPGLTRRRVGVGRRQPRGCPATTITNKSCRLRPRRPVPRRVAPLTCGCR